MMAGECDFLFLSFFGVDVGEMGYVPNDRLVVGRKIRGGLGAWNLKCTVLLPTAASGGVCSGVAGWWGQGYAGTVQ